MSSQKERFIWKNASSIFSTVLPAINTDSKSLGLSSNVCFKRKKNLTYETSYLNNPKVQQQQTDNDLTHQRIIKLKMEENMQIENNGNSMIIHKVINTKN